MCFDFKLRLIDFADFIDYTPKCKIFHQKIYKLISYPNSSIQLKTVFLGGTLPLPTRNRFLRIEKYINK